MCVCMLDAFEVRSNAAAVWCVCAAVRMHGYMRVLPVIMCSPTPRPDGCRTPTYLLAQQHRWHCSIHRTPTTRACTHTQVS